MEDIFDDFLTDVGRTFFLAPFARIQTLLQTQDLIPSLKGAKPLGGFGDCFSRIVKTGTSISLWRGGVPFMLTLFSNSALQLRISDDLYNPKKTSQDNRQKFRSDILGTYWILKWNLIFHPLEVLRVRISCDNAWSFDKYGQGMVETVRRLARSEGITTFYKGYFPMSAYMIIRQDAFNPSILNLDTKPAAIATRFLKDLTLYPLLVISHRMMIEPDGQEGYLNRMINCCKKTFKEFGMRGFYKGFGISLALQAINVMEKISSKTKN